MKLLTNKEARKIKPADKYELLRKALRAEGLEIDTLDEDDYSYLDAVFGFANTVLDIRSFCQQ